MDTQPARANGTPRCPSELLGLLSPTRCEREAKRFLPCVGRVGIGKKH